MKFPLPFWFGIPFLGLMNFLEKTTCQSYNFRRFSFSRGDVHELKHLFEMLQHHLSHWELQANGEQTGAKPETRFFFQIKFS